MAPALNHTGVTFIDDGNHRAVWHVDASIYYGGVESFTRSRIYSHYGDERMI